jgi:hypothetical protein
MLPTEARVGHLAKIRARNVHAYMSHWTCSGPLQLLLSPPLLRVPTWASHEFLANWVPLALKDPQCLHVSVE